MDQIESSKGVMEMSVIHRLADDLLDLSKIYQSDYLADCGEDLKQNADSFDVTGIQTTFKKLEMALLQLESTLSDATVESSGNGE